MPRVLCLKGFWAFCVRADVSQCFHRDSTGADTTTGVADTTAGTAASLKKAERFTENSERFSESRTAFPKVVGLFGENSYLVAVSAVLLVVLAVPARG